MSFRAFSRFLFIAMCVHGLPSLGQTVYTSKTIHITFFSKTPVEDINAASASGVSVVNLTTKEIAFQVKMESFSFPHALMQEHFNENYMESERFPLAKFKGFVQEPIDLTHNGVYPVTVKGILTMHGVSKERTISGKITVENDHVSLYSQFKVACTDHEIKIPRLVIAKIAEIITVTVQGNYLPNNPKSNP